MLYDSLNWISLESAKEKIDPSGPIEYGIQHPVVKPSAFLYDPRKVKFKKQKRLVPKQHPLPLIISSTKLFDPRASVLAISGDENLSCLYENSINIIRGPSRTLTQINRAWKRSQEIYHYWKRDPACTAGNDEHFQQRKPQVSAFKSPSDEEEPVAEDQSKKLLKAGKSDKQNKNVLVGCTLKIKSSHHAIAKLENVHPASLQFDSLVDSHGRFPEESASSEDGDDERVNQKASITEQRKDPPQPNQRKFRQLRRATRKLIAWIESLKPQQTLHYHWTINMDGTKTNVLMHPYIPYPEEQQPYPLVDEEEIVDMVRNAYGSRPTLAMKVAVHDMENLSHELEKFDNYYYFQERIIEDRVYKKFNQKMEPEVKPSNFQLRPVNKYSFGMQPQIISRKIPAIGTIHDTSTDRKCHYGVWYLRKSLWRKMDVSEEIKRHGAHDSDEVFERVTGTNRFHVVDSHISAVAKTDTHVCDLYASKEFYKILKHHNHPIPVWLRGCESEFAGDPEGPCRRSIPFGSEVWRAVNAPKLEEPARKSRRIYNVKQDSAADCDLDLPRIDPKLYAFVESLQNN